MVSLCQSSEPPQQKEPTSPADGGSDEHDKPSALIGGHRHHWPPSGRLGSVRKLVTYQQDGHSYATSPGSSPTGPLLTSSSIGTLQRGQAKAPRLFERSDTTPASKQCLRPTNAPQFRRLRHHGPFTAGRFPLKNTARGVGDRRGSPQFEPRPMPIRPYLDGHRFENN